MDLGEIHRDAEARAARLRHLEGHDAAALAWLDAQLRVLREAQADGRVDGEGEERR